jgi:hypothetical protein
LTNYTDWDLGRADVQALSGADALATFFARLGYDTTERLPLSAAALGIGAESLARKIRRVERVAQMEEGALQVYLVELDSVTVAARQGLARALRDRAPNFLLVLTDDYVRLDFVLLERALQATRPGNLSAPRLAVHARLLSLDRHHPDKIALRVLRRFTCTEPDADAQYDKLRAAFLVAAWSEEHFNNRALFADYYLVERLPERPEWSEGVLASFQQLQVLDQQARERRADSAALRHALLEPTLQALGYTWTQPHGPEAPDYLLQAGDARVACLAYPWDRALDGKDELRDHDRPDDNPGVRVVSVLDAGAAPWAIVTNGKYWRLYAAAAHSRATNYYEIDLEETLAQRDPSQAFRYFWLLFRAAAFQPRPVAMQCETRELSFVDQLFLESGEYAKRLGERLKERVFEEVFPEIAQGFITWLRAHEGDAVDLSQPRLDQVFRATLTLLYRVLFLLYAEARDLLPVREERGYAEISLSQLKREIAEAAGPIKDEASRRLARRYSAAPTATTLYQWLLDLAAVVDRGDPHRNTPLYNGGCS